MLKTDTERVYWKQISADYMSEESQDESNGTINRHRLMWTSQRKFPTCCNFIQCETVQNFHVCKIHYTEYR